MPTIDDFLVMHSLTLIYFYSVVRRSIDSVFLFNICTSPLGGSHGTCHTRTRAPSHLVKPKQKKLRINHELNSKAGINVSHLINKEEIEYCLVEMPRICAANVQHTITCTCGLPVIKVDLMVVINDAPWTAGFNSAEVALGLLLFPAIRQFQGGCRSHRAPSTQLLPRGARTARAPKVFSLPSLPSSPGARPRLTVTPPSSILVSTCCNPNLSLCIFIFRHSPS